MPPAVLRQARGALDSLEKKARAAQAQIDLFAAPALPELADDISALGSDTKLPALVPAAQPDPAESATLQALAELNPDTLTPREALDALYRLKALLPALA
jgi:DNA mismatch repair protein MutS